MCVKHPDANRNTDVSNTVGSISDVKILPTYTISPTETNIKPKSDISELKFIG
jgi:hypothetical protein